MLMVGSKCVRDPLLSFALVRYYFRAQKVKQSHRTVPALPWLLWWVRTHEHAAISKAGEWNAALFTLLERCNQLYSAETGTTVTASSDLSLKGAT